MNFNAVRQGNEQNIAMSGVLANLAGVTYTAQGKPKQACTITDANGETVTVSIYQGNGMAIPADKVGQTLSFNLSYKISKQNGKGYYGGFWNSTAQVAPLQVQAPPQQPQQAPPQAARSFNAQSPPDWDAIAAGKVRHGVVCAYLQGGKEPDLGRVLYWTDFIITGNVPLPPAKTCLLYTSPSPRDRS